LLLALVLDFIIRQVGYYIQHLQQQAIFL